jgi:hypothetical protein
VELGIGCTYQLSNVWTLQLLPEIGERLVIKVMSSFAHALTPAFTITYVHKVGANRPVLTIPTTSCGPVSTGRGACFRPNCPIVGQRRGNPSSIAPRRRQTSHPQPPQKNTPAPSIRPTPGRRPAPGSGCQPPVTAPDFRTNSGTPHLRVKRPAFKKHRPRPITPPTIRSYSHHAPASHVFLTLLIGLAVTFL